MRIIAASALILAAMSPSFAAAQQQAPASQAPSSAPAATHYTVEDTDIGTLLDDPAAKAVLDKNLPGFSANPQIDMARSMTLKAIQQYSAESVTDEKLAAVQADLAKLPIKK